MNLHFPPFAQIVAAGFQRAVQLQNVFVVEPDNDLYDHYLASFPAGTNPIFKTNTEHHCSCCKQFIKHVGNVVAIEGERLLTIWEYAARNAPYPYNVVASRLHHAVLASPISDLFRVSTKEASFGAEQALSLDEDGTVHTWNHFYTEEIPRSLRVASPDQVRGDYRTTVQVFERGLTELSPEAVETVLSLIEANSLYRGAEHKSAVQQFQKMQQEFLQLDERARHLFIWQQAKNLGVARFRNTVIGTLVQDLSEGVDLERAVASFESKVAPQNYKRTTALITPKMVESAMETIRELGLESALERRLARLSDISVNDVKWVDGSVKPLMKGGIGDMLVQHVKELQRENRNTIQAEPISLDDFMERILPETTSMELLFQGEHLSNLMVLTAPVHPEPKRLFKWTNDFAWSYGGNVTDSIKERVKKAGGRVENVSLRVSLSWFNYDDLDLHVHGPHGEHIFYANRDGRRIGG